MSVVSKRAGSKRGSGPISVAEFQRRRARVLESLGGSVALVLAGDGSPPLSGFWQPDFSFSYLTGITTEPGASVLFDPRAEDPKRRCILFLKPLNPEVEAWDGYRDQIGTPLKEKHGFETVLRTNMLARTITTLARQRKKLACLHPFSVYESPVSGDLALFRKVCDRVPGVSIEDRTDLLPSMRAIKSKAELEQMRGAIRATALGYEAAAGMIRPGVNEKDIQRVIESGFVRGGASGPAYNSIVGAGLNATVLHYMQNSTVVRQGDLIVIDAGAKYNGYAADITRTFPASGVFSPRQRKLYDLVLEAQAAAIRAVKPGVMMHQVNEAARAVFTKAGLQDKYIHGIGHQLGMEVHDVTPDGPLKPGMVVTIEPGLYLPEESTGIRIEDDILVTAGGRENLSNMIPKQANEIERMMRSFSRRKRS